MTRGILFLLLPLSLIGLTLSAKSLPVAATAGSLESIVPIELTPEEKAWLAEHKDIRLGVDPSWPPFEFFDTTRVYSGIASYYVSRLNEHLHINMKPVQGLSWTEVMEKAEAREIDALPCIAKTPERSKILLFTKPYLSFPMVILTRRDAPFINGVEDFESGRVAVIKGYITQELLETEYPEKEFHLTDDIEEALLAVSKGKVDAYVGNLASITYSTQRLGLTNLKVATATPYRFELSFAVRKDWPELVDILNKSMHLISDSEETKIHNRWINVRFERQFDWMVVFKIVIPIVFVCAITLILFIRWNRTLTREVTERKLAEEALRESEGRFRGYFEASQIGMSVTSPEKGWIEVNQQLQTMLGYSLEELRQLTWAELTHPDDLEEDLRRFERMLAGGIDHYKMDKRFIRKDGKTVHANLSVACVRNENGDVINVLASLLDITDRKIAEEELRRNMEDLKRFSDMAVGREERMIELKEEINELLKESGQQEKYKIVV